MAKTYLSAVKYNIIAEFEIDGIVDKPDIIGAIFGQSEGLLGQEMDLKQLQQNGKIGRIEIDSKLVNGKTTGSIVIPSSMDMAQTSLLAAAIESVDKVGPCDAQIETKKIEDTRGQKRKAISSRAQELLSQFMKEEIPESQEMTDTLVKSVRIAKLVPYGPEKLPAGPDIDSSEEIIVVEGRADVLNLLRYGITNVIGMEGSNVPKTLIELAKTKTVIAFVDGDRGGELNARHLQEVAKLDFVIRAPDGKEVEELAQKEIVMAMRKKVVPTEAFQRRMNSFASPPHNTFERRDFSRPGYRASMPRPPMRGERERRFSTPRPALGPDELRRDGMGPQRTGFSRRPDDRYRGRSGPGFGRGPSREPDFGRSPPRRTDPPSFNPTEEKRFSEPITPLTADEQKNLVPIMKELHGSLKARLLDQNTKQLAEITVRELIQKIKETKGTQTIVFDGIITKRLAEEAEKLGVERLVGIKKGWFKSTGKIKLLTIAT
ncbi:DNA primase [Candidatus Micrarchaeota archaeon]|nr:DNA primase [Candidatus Micrarchaeota archaeon]MBU1930000.1 DNA primase [Candidatus Micrarchaeota archaeon]